MGAALLGAACAEDGIFTEDEWSRVESLGAPITPPADPSNRFVGDSPGMIDPGAVALGHLFYFDPQFSGKSNLKDMLGRKQAGGRAPEGTEVNISCKTCHDPAQGGSDHTSPGNVSFGVGFYDVNSQQTPNSGHYGLIYWNGRVDSLWAQIVAVAESGVSMGGSRLKATWRIADVYRDAYESLDVTPLPDEIDTVAAQKARLNADGTCILDAGDVCPTVCRAITPTEPAVLPAVLTGGNCFPRFPLQGKPGGKTGCQPGDAAEPNADAFDCMDAADQKIITTVYVNYTKIIAAYEFALTAKNSAFDRFVAEGPDSTQLSDAARRGLKLFVGKASCVDCHDGPMFTDGAGPDSYGVKADLLAGTAPGFHNIGIPQTGPFVPSEGDCIDGAACDCVASEVNPDDPTTGPPKNCLPWGLWDGLSKLRGSPMRRDRSWSDAYEANPDDPTMPTLTDTARSAWYFKADDPMTPDVNEGESIPAAYRGMWRTPSLRDVALTAPYMHTGVYDTLWDVVDHYNFGGSAGGPVVGEKDSRLRPLYLTEQEIGDLVEFLSGLTSTLPTEVDERKLYFPPSIPAASPF